MKTVVRLLGSLCIVCGAIMILLGLSIRGRAMEDDDEDYGDVDIGCSSISIPSIEEGEKCEEQSTKKQEKSVSNSEQKS